MPLGDLGCVFLKYSHPWVSAGDGFQGSLRVPNPWMPKSLTRNGTAFACNLHTSSPSPVSFKSPLDYTLGFPGGSGVKSPPSNAGDMDLVPGKIPLEKEMATYSSILAWEIPRTEEPGGLYSP